MKKYSFCSKFKCEIDNDYVSFFSKLSERELFTLLRKMKVLKSDPKCNAGVINILNNGENISLFVKHFKFGSKISALTKIQVLKNVKKMFHKNNRLLENGIPVPIPVAYFNNLKGNESFYISSFLEEGLDFGLYYKKNKKIELKITKMISENVALFHSKKISHGDLKWSNLVINKGMVFFIDIDRVSFNKTYSKIKIMKDLIRFFRFAVEIGGVNWLREEFFPIYSKNIPDKVLSFVDYGEIYKKALKEYKIKRKGIPQGKVFEK